MEELIDKLPETCILDRFKGKWTYYENYYALKMEPGIEQQSGERFGDFLKRVIKSKSN